jgi:hypothetical protein
VRRRRGVAGRRRHAAPGDEGQVAFFGRQTFMDNLFTDPMNAHLATFAKYPPKKT